MLHHLQWSITCPYGYTMHRDRSWAECQHYFGNVHGIGCWIQCNIQGLQHTTTFNKPVLHIIYSLMTQQNNICLSMILLQQIVANSQHTRGFKYSLSVLVTHLCRIFLLDEECSKYDKVSVAPEHVSGAYSLHSVWTPIFLPEDSM